MEITAIDQEITDYDWFAIDNQNNIAHLASAGGRLPLSVTQSAEDNALLVNYFQSLEVNTDTLKINPRFQVPSSMQSPEMQKIFFRTFSFYSTRGLYSFNRNELDSRGRMTDFEYSLLTIPFKPINIDILPSNIRKLLCKTRYNGLFPVDNIINSRNIT